MAKLGRNDPCPCGSGNKYKKCCLAKEEAVAREQLVKAQAPRDTLRRDQRAAEASVADQARGGQGEDSRVELHHCRHAAHHDRDAAVRIGRAAGGHLRLR
jgi:SEC-C motif